MLASYVARAERRHGLKSLAYELFRFEMRDLRDIIGSGKKEIRFVTRPSPKRHRMRQQTPMRRCDSRNISSARWIQSDKRYYMSLNCR